MQTSQAIREELTELFGPYSSLCLTGGDYSTYQQLRGQEQQLVSIVDGKDLEGEFGALVLWTRDEPLGAASYLVQTNSRKPTPANRYARIDIVIVPEESRGLGAGRLLVQSTTLFLLQTYGRQLYSISCLAAHPAIEKCLEELSFKGEERENQNFIHEEIRLEGLDMADLEAEVHARAKATLKLIHYTLRQRNPGD